MTPSIQIEHPQHINTDSSDLSCHILIGRNFLSYAILNNACTILYRLTHYAFQDKLIGKNDFNEILADPVFQKTAKLKIAIDSLKSTLIPKAYFDTATAESYFSLLHDLPASESIHNQGLPNGMHALFSLKKSTISFLGSWRKNIEFRNAASCLLQAYPSLLGNEQQAVVFLWIRDDHVTLTFYREGKLMGQHEYAETTETDTCYHLGKLCSVYSLDRNVLGIFIHGEGEKITRYYDEVVQYFPRVQYSRRSASLQYPDNISSLPSHYFLTLLSMAVCES